MVSDGEIRVEVQNILNGANLETTTSRTVRKEVASRLNLGEEESESIKSAVEREISIFLDSQNADPLPCTPVDAPSSQPEKRKRSSNTPEAKPAKQPKPNSAKTNSAGEVEFVLSENRKVLLREFNGRQLIDVRELYEKDGKQLPSSKGLAMSPVQWQKLVEAMPQLTSAAGEGYKGFSLDLGNNRLASVKMYKGKTQVDLREHYEKDGDLDPGKKGIALTVEQWETLCGFAEHITDLAGKAAEPASAVKKEKASKQKAEAGGSAGGSGGEGAPEFVELGNRKRASISEFKGKKLLNLREYYEKDGQLLPGKKGISLTKDQAEILLENVDALSEALTSKADFSVPVGSRRYAKVNKFKSAYTIDIREYYEKDGEEKPGMKGLSMTEEQWGILNSHLKQLVWKF